MLLLIVLIFPIQHLYYLIQIHRMLLLIQATDGGKMETQAIQIHRMLLLIKPFHYQKEGRTHSNTSYVAINLASGNSLPTTNLYSNTSYVAINQLLYNHCNHNLLNSNTSYVAINQM